MKTSLAASNDSPELASLNAIQTKTIVRLALLEGATFPGLIVAFLESNPLALGVAAVSLAMMVASFPTANRIDADLKTIADELRHAK